MKIYVAGHQGLVGSALTRNIELGGQHYWLGKSRSELDLLDRKSVFDFIRTESPDAILISAAKVGGIQANDSLPVEFLSENLQIELNLIDGAHAAQIRRVLFLGSSCVYPKLAPQPLKEEYLMSGPLEKTNESYALAKIAGLKLIHAYRKEHGHSWISAMPTNIYGPGDNFDLASSHVIPGLIRRFHEAKVGGAKTVSLWGSGTPRREFLHTDDLASACLFLLENYDDEVAINVGVGEDISIKDLAGIVQQVVGFDGEISWDSGKPDGTPRKLLDVSKITALGWKPKIELEEGIRATYEWFKLNH
jgi:GDP-L-fucose synthase